MAEGETEYVPSVDARPRSGREILRRSSGLLQSPSRLGIGNSGLIAVPLSRIDKKTGKPAPDSVVFIDAVNRSKYLQRAPIDDSGRRVTVGRGQCNVIIQGDRTISREHANISWKNGDGFVVIDTSENGTDLQPLPQIRLYPPTKAVVAVQNRGDWLAVQIDKRRHVEVVVGDVGVLKYSGGSINALGGVQNLNPNAPILIGSGEGNDIRFTTDRGIDAGSATCVIVGDMMLIRKDGVTSDVSIRVDDGASVGSSELPKGPGIRKTIAGLFRRSSNFDPVLEHRQTQNYLKMAGSSMPSPHHENQDRFGFGDIIGSDGLNYGKRAFVVDGAGGEGKPEQIRDFVNNCASICARNLSSRTGLASLRYVDQAMGYFKEQLRNLATGTIGIVELLHSGEMHISSKGDIGVLFWKPGGYEQNRAEWLTNEKLGGAPFQLQNPIQNRAQLIHAMGGLGQHGWTTGQSDDHPMANQIVSGIAVGNDNHQPFSIKLNRNYIQQNGADFALVGSDGMRLASELISRHPDKHKVQTTIDRIMRDLSVGKISHQRASELATRAVREITGDSDDITCVIIDLREWKRSTRAV